jgi:hypothetical protein
MDAEQRQFIRVKERLLTFITFLTTGKVERALTRDIGAVGVCLMTETVLEPGTQLAVELHLPDRKGPISFMAEVRWSRPLGGTRDADASMAAETGLQFVRVDPKDRSMMMQHAALHALPG